MPDEVCEVIVAAYDCNKQGPYLLHSQTPYDNITRSKYEIEMM